MLVNNRIMVVTNGSATNDKKLAYAQAINVTKLPPLQVWTGRSQPAWQK